MRIDIDAIKESTDSKTIAAIAMYTRETRKSEIIIMTQTPLLKDLKGFSHVNTS
jgi:hypothetical protein